MLLLLGEHFLFLSVILFVDSLVNRFGLTPNDPNRQLGCTSGLQSSNSSHLTSKNTARLLAFVVDYRLSKSICASNLPARIT